MPRLHLHWPLVLLVMLVTTAWFHDKLRRRTRLSHHRCRWCAGLYMGRFRPGSPVCASPLLRQHYHFLFWIRPPYLTMRGAKRRTAPMVLSNCQLEATPSSRNGASTYTSDTLHLPSWKAPCDGLGVLLERSMNVPRAQSPKVSTQPRLRVAISCRWRQLATHMHSLLLSCVLMSFFERFRAGKGISPVRCGCCSHPWYTVPWTKGCCPEREPSPIVSPALSYGLLLGSCG